MPNAHPKPGTVATDGARPQRLFVAIALPATITDGLAGIQAEMRAVLPPDCMRWVARRHFHLTLVFLGDVAQARFGALAEVLESTCATLPALELSAAQLGCFVHQGQPQVIWAGVTDRLGVLSRVQAQLTQATRAFTRTAPPTSFAPHVTLARCARMAPAVAQSLAALISLASAREFGHWQARGVELVHSRFSAQGACYRCVQHFPFSGS